MTPTLENRKYLSPQRLSSEHYRQMLVRDGERRFREWHGNFLAYQRKFLAAMKQVQSR